VVARFAWVVLIELSAASTLLDEFESIADEIVTFEPAAIAASMLDEEFERFVELPLKAVRFVAKVAR
jgi:hypothetical protein